MGGIRSHAFQQITTTSLIFYALGFAALGLSAVTNVEHVTDGVTELGKWWSLAVGAAVVTGLFVGLPTAAASSWRSGRYGVAMLAMIVAAVAGVLSLGNLAGASLGRKMAVTANATDSTDKRADAKRLADKAEAEVAALGSPRPPASIQSEIDAKLTSRNDLAGCEGRWLESSRARSVCIDVAALRAEKAKADRKADLEDQIAEARAVLDKVPASGTVGNGSTAGFVGLLALFGLKVEAATVELLASVMMAVVVEAGAAVSFMVAAATMKAPIPAVRSASADAVRRDAKPMLDNFHPAPECQPQTEEASWQPIESTIKSDVAAGVSAAPRKLRVADDLADRLLDVVATQGGTVLGSSRLFGKALGVSHTRAGEVLDELEAAGRVTVERSRRGTVVRLAFAA